VTELIDRYQGRNERLVSSTQRRVAAVFAAYESGQITNAEARTLIASILHHANGAAVGMADRFIADQIEKAARVPVPALGHAPERGLGRLHDAVGTILAEAAGWQAGDTDSPLMRLRRLGRSEPLHHGHKSASVAMKRHKAVRGWVRAMDANACQLCEWWYRDGQIWSDDTPFQSHPGCNCQAEIFTE
jgi:hypothetical protein